MNRRIWLASCGLAIAAAMTGCNSLPLEPVDPPPQRPDRVLNFGTLYSENCAACHGERGQGGAVIALASPVYLAIASDEVIRKVITNGVPGTPMSAFAQSAGGMLTDEQVSALVNGIRQWAQPGKLAAVQPPPYAADTPGNVQRGPQVFQMYCSSCHGPDGKGGKKAGSVVDPSYLALVSDQDLRTIVIVGRPEFGAPDWRNDLPGHPMTDQDVSDVVAWLQAQRVRYPGQPYPEGQAGSATRGGKP
ncbi:MAG: c-type cytochrome [Acidobacteriota bacterium]|nr:c-type cytochrome [Acidobacteriota bacterium]